MCTLCQARDPSIQHYDTHGAVNFARGETAIAAAKPVYTYDQIADYLTRGFWSDFGTVARHFDVRSGGTLTYNLDGLTAHGAATARKALDAWTAVSGLRFQEVALSSARIVFDDNNSGAYASSMVSGGHILKSFINVHASWSNYGDYYYQTFMHEIGHALGLGHTGNYNGSASYGGHAGYANDSWQTSVMSYFSQSENTWSDATRMYLATLQLGDIAAIQKLYGTPVNVESGNTVYGDGETTGRFGMNLSGKFAVAIVDSGGIDLINLASRSSNQYLSLVEETYSNLNGWTGNFSIGRDTIIENAITGSGHDHIVGNRANNRIDSGAGNDRIQAGAGNDILIGGRGNDILSGGSGNDVFVMRPGDGADRITDFQRGAGTGDRIDVSAYGLTFDQIRFSTTSEGLRIHLQSDSILLQGVALPKLGADAFLGLVSAPQPLPEDIEMTGIGLRRGIQNTYEIVDGNTIVTVRYLGNAIGPDSIEGWKAVQAGSDGAGGYNLLWQNKAGIYGIWTVNANGAWVNCADMATAVDYEVRFVFDINRDGVIGHTMAALDEDGVELWASSTRNFYRIVDGDTDLTVTYLGRQMGPDSLAGWRALQVEADGAGGYHMLWQNKAGTYGVWQVDATGAWASSFVAANEVDCEDLFDVDLNGDGAIGHTMAALDEDGVELWASSTRNLYRIVDGDADLALTYLGKKIGPASLAGWKALQAESDGAGGYHMLWQNKAGTYGVWDVDSNGAWARSFVAANSVDCEELFDFDLNGDGIIGHTMDQIERNGVELWASSTRNVYRIVDGDTDLAVTYLGREIGPDSLAGWKALQAGSDGAGGYNLLWQDAYGTYGIWDVDSNGAWIRSVSAASAMDFEDRFDFDISGDGVIGEWMG